MNPAGNNRRTKCRFKSFIGLGSGATKLPASACAIRSVFFLAAFSALLLAARPAQAQAETVLYNFCSDGDDCTDGAIPYSSLTPDGAGNFYGTTFSGGKKSFGTVFELSPNGGGGWNETVLHSFAEGPDGGFPIYSGVIFDSVGNLYGTTYIGGKYKQGVVYELSPAGAMWKETILHTFTGGADGGRPESGLIMDEAGNLYGATIEGGPTNHGTIFELSPSGGAWMEQVIRDAGTEHGGLAIDAAGNIFGVSVNTVFELAPNGKGGWKSIAIHVFGGNGLVSPEDGRDPQGTPVIDQAGNLYGTTYSGGANNDGTVYELSLGSNGKWTEEILYSFQGSKQDDGSNPWAGIVFDTAGNLYGTTITGGTSNNGTVFKLTAPAGGGGYQEEVLWSFDKTDGFLPFGGLTLDGAGNLYGTAAGGGLNDSGVVYEVTP